MCGSMYISHETRKQLAIARDERIINTAILMANIADSKILNEEFVNINEGSYGETASRKYIASIAEKLAKEGEPTSILDLWEKHIKNSHKE